MILALPLSYALAIVHANESLLSEVSLKPAVVNRYCFKDQFKKHFSFKYESVCLAESE